MTEPTGRTERCEVCRWWEAVKSSQNLGTCHRHAPTEPSKKHNWPKTQADDWCGE